VKFDTGDRVDRRSSPRAKFHVYRGRNVGIQPRNCQNFEFWPQICPSGVTRLPNLYEILRFCTRLQVDFKCLLWLLSGYKQISYKHFPAVGAFSLKFSIAPSGQTTDRIKKKLGDAKTGRTSSITMPSMVGIVGRAPAVDEKA